MDQRNISDRRFQIPVTLTLCTTVRATGLIYEDVWNANSPLRRPQFEHTLRGVNSFLVILDEDAYFEKSRDIPIVFQRRQASFSTDEIIKNTS
jgi:hypothetical protein